MSEELKIIQKCQGCAFETEPGACRFDRPRKFEAHGATLEMVDGHLLIHNRKCNYFYPSDGLGDRGVDEIADKVASENAVIPPVIVNGFRRSLVEMRETMDSLLSQTSLPSYIWFISNYELSESQIRELKGDFPLSKFKYQLIKVGDYVEPHIDSAVNRIGKCKFYVLIEAGNRLRSDVLESIDKLLNDQCGRFVYWSGDNFEVFHTDAHKAVGGHSLPFLDYEEAESLPDKLIWWVDKNGSPDLIFDEGCVS